MEWNIGMENTLGKSHSNCVIIHIWNLYIYYIPTFYILTRPVYYSNGAIPTCFNFNPLILKHKGGKSLALRTLSRDKVENVMIQNLQNYWFFKDCIGDKSC